MDTSERFMKGVNLFQGMINYSGIIYPRGIIYSRIDYPGGKLLGDNLFRDTGRSWYKKDIKVLLISPLINIFGVTNTLLVTAIVANALYTKFFMITASVNRSRDHAEL